MPKFCFLSAYFSTLVSSVTRVSPFCDAAHKPASHRVPLVPTGGQLEDKGGEGKTPQFPPGRCCSRVSGGVPPAAPRLPSVPVPQPVPRAPGWRPRTPGALRDFTKGQTRGVCVPQKGRNGDFSDGRILSNLEKFGIKPGPQNAPKNKTLRILCA